MDGAASMHVDPSHTAVYINIFSSVCMYIYVYIYIYIYIFKYATSSLAHNAVHTEHIYIYLYIQIYKDMLRIALSGTH